MKPDTVEIGAAPRKGKMTRSDDENSPSILIVDPDRFRREGLAAILRMRWPAVRCGFASSYRAALDMLEKEKWKLVVTDLNISGRGGLDLVSKINEEKKISTLLISGEPEEIYGLRALRNGSAGYLRRELPPEVITEAIAAVLSGGRYVSDQLAQKLAGQFDPYENEESIPFDALSDREFQVLRSIADGQCIKEIAASLSLSSKTVSTYRVRTLAKLGLKSDAELVKYCLEHGLTGGGSR